MAFKIGPITVKHRIANAVLQAGNVLYQAAFLYQDILTSIKHHK
jgi:hypothetical protein